jgi:hypothetical protein
VENHQYQKELHYFERLLLASTNSSMGESKQSVCNHQLLGILVHTRPSQFVRLPNRCLQSRNSEPKPKVRRKTIQNHCLLVEVVVVEVAVAVAVEENHQQTISNHKRFQWFQKQQRHSLKRRFPLTNS